MITQQDARKALINRLRRWAQPKEQDCGSEECADCANARLLHEAADVLEALSSSSGSSEKPQEEPTREELIGYLAECYRATGSIQTVGCPDEEVAGHAAVAVQMLARRTQRGTYFDAESRTWIAREIVTSAGRTEEEAREALKSAIRLLADTWPPRDADIALDALAAIGSEVLCEACAKVFCPHCERLHFHHDGCPACSSEEDEAQSSPSQSEEIPALEPCPICDGSGKVKVIAETPEERKDAKVSDPKKDEIAKAARRAIDETIQKHGNEVFLGEGYNADETLVAELQAALSDYEALRETNEEGVKR